jgi:hypothetical protein
VPGSAATSGTAKAGTGLAVAGCGAFTVKRTADAVPLAEETVMLIVPALAIRLAGTVAVNSDALFQVVVSAVEPHIAVEVAVNPSPLMISVEAAPPAIAEAGVRLVITGDAAHAAGNNARAAGILNINPRRNERAHCI